MPKYDCIAMLLAGGEGKRLGELTKKNAKPAVLFGGKYRIIDFSLSNCTNSGIDTIGVLIQYEPLILNSYIGDGKPWDLQRKNGGVNILPPYLEKNGARWYKGTANAIYQNMTFIEQYRPRYVLILSGDHIYKMDYRNMLNMHIEKKADVTIAVKEVPWNEASRFGIMRLDNSNRVKEFQEKPKIPISNLASMGIYIFNWETLKTYLTKDNNNIDSSKDFGKDVIPLMLKEDCKMHGYSYSGYWRDVGTIASYWDASMDLLTDNPSLNLNDPDWKIYSSNYYYVPQYVGTSAKITKSLINEGCKINGTIDSSIIFSGVIVKKGSIIKNSIIMPNVKIGNDVNLNRVIVTENMIIPDKSFVDNNKDDILLI
ncbi:MAG: glucose-1-phosphate adenylyltransferase [Vulcanibacillus sp.]